jgi:N-ethylmaleimide reductase
MLFEAFTSPALHLKNRVVMAPLTRSRAVEANTPNALMAEYYAQRAGAGLIITEGTSPSPDGLGYARIPGLFNAAHVAGWRQVTDAVHAQGAKVFVQLMHTGRVAHVANLPAGARVVGPTAAVLEGQMYTDAQGMQAHSTPHAMTEAEVEQAVGEYVNAARLAIEAGFDGIELHAANGYLLEQFLNANVNTRTDAYGGSADKRNRFPLDVARATAAAIGADRVGIRVSPYGVFNATGAFEGVEDQFLALARELGALKLAYLHLVDHSSMGAPEVPAAFKARLKAAFGGTFIASGGFADRKSAEQALKDGRGDLVAFGRPWLGNPDLIERLKAGTPLNELDPSTFYTPGAKGYTDYPRADAALAAAVTS